MFLIKLYQQGEKTVNIYGTGQLAEITYYAGISTPLKLNAIISDDPSKKIFLGHEVFSLSDFIEKYSKNISQENLILLCTTDKEKLSQEISKYKNSPKNITIISIENILKNNH